MFLGDQIHQQNYVEDKDGKRVDLHSQASKGQCEFLYDLVTDLKPKTALETGLAYGLSSLYICKAMQENAGERHIIMDIFQSTDLWEGIGVLNLQRAGFEGLYEFHEAYAHDVIPEALKAGTRIQFAFLDASKVFDIVLVNMYFIDLIMDIGGVIVLDDCQFPGVNKVVSYWRNHPNYKLHSTFDDTEKKSSWKRDLATKVANMAPKKEKLFHPNLVNPAPTERTVAFEKISDETRHYSWHHDF